MIVLRNIDRGESRGQAGLPHPREPRERARCWLRVIALRRRRLSTPVSKVAGEGKAEERV